ncbi:unnamed protein product [Tilletia controversa]|uniref:Uncharacterized protein n=3 Tax=Tilletia TaxID=13289 RepID=A0A8X7SZA7_9BASI|nr:hypothetical protein CF336_g6608 [Tilletia laevis]KAE8201372.1 hypothetical protein CF328_g2686 [Tilletia controversa]KAE8252694.1 hypothetical protein A4X03_0g6097 [Tilletia caries]KAE8191810.1 hypothetical protein CF335_g5989 [Tilletia laevis]KAE8253431.1 hypothetical protein A4X06_0g1462 [Tilletia controversa]
MSSGPSRSIAVFALRLAGSSSISNASVGSRQARALAHQTARPSSDAQRKLTLSAIPKLRPVPSTVQCRTRTFSTSSAIAQGAEGTKTIRHPEHPTGIYFHLVPELSSASSDWKDAQSGAEGQRTSTWAITLLDQPPSSIEAASIMGFVRVTESAGDGPASGHVESGSSNDASASADPVAFSHANPSAVQPNPAFFELLHKTLRDECVEEDELLRFEAQMRKSGWAHVNDQREQLMPGRQAWPENILASIVFIDGELQARPKADGTGDSQGSYQPNDAYRLLTAQDGFIQLKQTWLDKVRKRCAEHN